MSGTATKDASSELAQIVLLTLAMTGGGLLLLFLVIHFIMARNLGNEVSVEAKNYEALVKLLSSDDMNRLRQEAEKQKSVKSQKKSLMDIITQKRDEGGLRFNRLAPPKFDDKLGTETRTIGLESSRMDRIFRFTVGVRDAKKTIEVEKLEMQAPRRSRGQDELLFTATVVFVDYSYSPGRG